MPSQTPDLHPGPLDIYGDAKAATAPAVPTFDPSALASLASVLSARDADGATPSSSAKVQLQVCDALPGYGAIRNMTTGLIDDEVSLSRVPPSPHYR